MKCYKLVSLNANRLLNNLLSINNIQTLLGLLNATTTEVKGFCLILVFAFHFKNAGFGVFAL